MNTYQILSLHLKQFIWEINTNALLENSDNFTLRRGLEMYCNQKALLVRGVRPFIDFN